MLNMYCWALNMLNGVHYCLLVHNCIAGATLVMHVMIHAFAVCNAWNEALCTFSLSIV